MTDSLQQRKSEHIRITLDEQVTGNRITTGFEQVKFIHNALPEINFDDIELQTTFLGKRMKTPFLVSSMTGGAAFAETINRHLAEAAEERGWVLALGSTRALIESEAYRSSFQLRQYAPSVPIIANLGAVQFNYGFTVDQCKQILEYTDADAFVLHLNSLQEVIQPEGDVNFETLLPKIEQLCNVLGVPVGAKEVGWGIDGKIAKKLYDCGIAFIDVAGAGGTSWSQVEKYRTTNPIQRQAAEAFSEWGIPTAASILSVRNSEDSRPLIASGGLHTGVDAAKALALGANMAGFGRSILKEATLSTEKLLETMETREFELKMAMFGIGAKTIESLNQTDRLLITDQSMSMWN